MITSTETVVVTQRTLSLTGEQSAPPEALPAPTETKLPQIKKVPEFSDNYEARKWEKGQMAAAFRVFAKLGYADGVAGHMSLRGNVITLLHLIELGLLIG
jgi:hypothetical protein